MGLKRRDSHVVGVEAASYHYVVVKLAGNKSVEVWVDANELEEVVQELRFYAPGVVVDRTLREERVDVRL